MIRTDGLAGRIGVVERRVEDRRERRIWALTDFAIARVSA